MRRNSSAVNTYSYYRPHTAQRGIRRDSNLTILLRWIVARRWLLTTKPARIGGVLLILALIGHNGWTKHVAAEAAAQRAADHQALLLAEQKSEQFQVELAHIMAANPGVTTSVSVATAELGQQDFGTQNIYDAASTGKLLTAITYLSLVEQHKLSLTKTIGGKPAKDLLDAMIIKSDDPAWALLNGVISHDRLSAEATKLGITDYSADTNSLSAHDTALMLHAISAGTLLTPEHRQLLLSQMARANFRSYIVPAVEAPNLVYHKVGINEDNVHDAAIIKHGDTWLVLVIYTNGNGQYNWLKRAQMMQDITRAAQTAYL